MNRSGSTTTSASTCSWDPAAFVARSVRLVVPEVSGVPESVAVPSPLSVRLRPTGRSPSTSVRAAAGEPVVRTTKDPGWSTVMVASVAEENAGACCTTTVRVRRAEGETPFAAVTVRVLVPAVVGVPASVAVPSPLSTKDSPSGSVPVALRDACGKPVVVIVVDPARPTTNVASPSLVIAGASRLVTHSCWVAVPAAFCARTVSSLIPDAVGVPEIVAVPSPLSTNVRPAGTVPAVIVSAGAGTPVVLTVNEPAAPRTNVASSELVIDGADWTVTASVLVRVATELVAVRVTEVVPATVGVPVIDAVPSPRSVSVSPAGRPAAVMVGTGYPPAVTPNEPAWPRVNVAVGAWSSTGGPVTVRVEACVADPSAFVAPTVNVYVPPVVGVPARRPPDDRVRPGGSEPAVTEKVGAGRPVAARSALNAVPIVAAVGSAPVIAGGTLT